MSFFLNVPPICLAKDKSPIYANCWPQTMFPLLPHFPSQYVPWVSLVVGWDSLSLDSTGYLNVVSLCCISKFCFRISRGWLPKSLAVLCLVWFGVYFLASQHCQVTMFLSEIPFRYHSFNLGTSTSWNPQGLSRPVMGLLYLFIIHLECWCRCTFISSSLYQM